MKNKVLLLIGASVIISGCSTVKAAEKTGEKLDNVVSCETSSCLKTLRTTEVLEKDVLANGDTKYLMRIQKRQGSYFRALGYGAAAVLTLGVSEALTTPLEGSLQNENQFGVEAICNRDDFCHRLVVAQIGQPTIYVRGITTEEQAAVDAEKAKAEATN